jgi:hypothetical protein
MARKKQSKQLKEIKKQIDKSNKSPVVPLGIKIISVFFYALAIVYALFGLFAIISSNGVAESIVLAGGFDSSIVSSLSIAIVIFGLIIIALAILEFFIARGLWKLKTWARVLAIILSILGLLIVITSIVLDFRYLQILNLLVNLIIAIYLLFFNEVKEAFRKK